MKFNFFLTFSKLKIRKLNLQNILFWEIDLKKDVIFLKNLEFFGCRDLVFNVYDYMDLPSICL